jgi:ABC-type nitrate/sulfonate/bicarbonate transport system substrate-binding protein
VNKILATTFMAFGILAAHSAAAQQDPAEIVVGAGAAVYHAPVFVAAEKGIFEKHGLNAKVLVYQSGVEQINGQINGAQLVTLLGAAPFVSAVSNGMPLKIIAGFHGNPLSDSYADIFGVAASKQSGITKVEDLKGKKVGLHIGSGSEIYMNGLLADAGIDRNDVEYVHVPANNTLAAITTGDVDAIAVWEPWIANAVKNADATLVQHGGCTGCYETGITITTDDIIKNQPEELKRYLAAFAEAQQWVRNNKEEAADITARWLPGTERDVILAVLQDAPLDMRLSKNIYTGLDDKTIATLLAQDKIKQKISAVDIVDPEFQVYLQAEVPEYFSDLPEIPEDKRF